MQQCGDCGKIYDESEYASCPYCNGEEFCDDIDEDSSEEVWTGPCAECDGTGRIECDVCEGEGEYNSEVCTSCNGEGDMECPYCGGTGEATYKEGRMI